jgi:hypothetical protein
MMTSILVSLIFGISRSGVGIRCKDGIKKMSVLRSRLRGWAAHNVGVYKQQKGNLISTIDKLDVKAKSRDLTVHERVELSQAWDQLARLLREEEIKYYQRANVADVLLGDNNMKYFQMMANGKL